MKPARLAVIALPPLAVAVLLAGVLIDDDDTRRLFYRADVIVMKSLAAIGGFYASSAFRRGDYLRRAWTLFGIGYVLLAAVDVLLPSPVAPELPFTAGQLGVRGTMVLAANLASVAAMALMARAFGATGLEPSGSPGWRRVVDAAFVALTLSIVGPSIYVDVGDLWTHPLQSYAALVSDVCDLVALALVAPVLRTAVALRGGRLVWPWLLLTAMALTWIAYDATGSLAPALHVHFARIAPEEILRSVACTFAFMAGVAQRRAVRIAPSPVLARRWLRSAS